MQPRCDIVAAYGGAVEDMLEVQADGIVTEDVGAGRSGRQPERVEACPLPVGVRDVVQDGPAEAAAVDCELHAGSLHTGARRRRRPHAVGHSRRPPFPEIVISAYTTNVPPRRDDSLRPKVIAVQRGVVEDVRARAEVTRVGVVEPGEDRLAG